MTISISKTMLLSKLQLISKIIPAKSSTPILCNFLFETKEGRLYITGANDEGRITTSMECIFDEEVTLCIPTSIVDGLKNLPEQPINIYINPEKLDIVIKYQGGKFEIVGYHPGAYPKKKDIQTLGSISLTAKDLYTGIGKSIIMAAEDDLRPILTSVYIEQKSDAIYFVGTDGHGMGFLKKEKPKNDTLSLVISRSIAAIVKNLIPLSGDELNIKVGGDWSEISWDEYTVSFRNQEGRYPNWKSVVPKTNQLELIVDTKQLVGAIKRTSVFSNKVSCLIVFTISSNILKVSAKDIDFSTSAEENLEVEFNGKNLEIGLKGSIIQEMLSCIDDERTKITFSDPSRAILITPEKQVEKEQITYLLMPMTINY